MAPQYTKNVGVKTKARLFIPACVGARCLKSEEQNKQTKKSLTKGEASRRMVANLDSLDVSPVAFFFFFPESDQAKKIRSISVGSDFNPLVW